jgi:predicted CoA-binding protein
MKNYQLLRDEALGFVNDNDIAIAGVSRNPKKFGNIVFKTLKSKGMKVYPVNPNTESLDGELCYKSVHELPAGVKSLLVLLKPADTENVVREAIQQGITRMWIQQGSETPEAVKIANDAGIKVITDRCILMYAHPTGFHKFHRNLNKLFGKY